MTGPTPAQGAAKGEVDLDAVDLAVADPAGMLPATGTAGAQIRDGLAVVSAAAPDLAVLAQARPRSVIIAGMGGSAMAGDVAVALTPDAALPVQVVRGYALPAWVDDRDLVLAVSCSGGTEETLAIAQQAAARGATWAAVCAPGSALAALAQEHGVVHLPVDGGGRAPRANLWALTVPLLGLLDALGLPTPLDALGTLADALDAQTPLLADAPMAQNPAKRWAHELVVPLPMAWGTTPLGAVAAYRLMAQLAENADLPCVHGELPEANHNQVVVLDGAAAGPAVRLHLLRDADEHPQVVKRADVSTELARERGVDVTTVRVEGADAVLRFGLLIHRIDHATVHAAILRGIDPSDIAPITRLKERISR
jgi:glucose/mannose-6-phosphate isomerase